MERGFAVGRSTDTTIHGTCAHHHMTKPDNSVSARHGGPPLPNRDSDVVDLVDRCAAAEHDADAATLEGLLTADFLGIGPRGFQLPQVSMD
jgi:hypothetical protein